MMNCQDFHDRLHEYLDETLPSEVTHAIHEHLRQCAHCRQALTHEQAFAQSTRRSFDQATAGLSLRPETKRRLSEVMKSEPARLNVPRLPALQRLSALFFRPAVAIMALVAVLLIVIAIQFHSDEAGRRGISGMVLAESDNCVVSVPFQTEVRVFRWQHNTLEDSLSTGKGMAYASLGTEN